MALIRFSQKTTDDFYISGPHDEDFLLNAQSLIILQIIILTIWSLKLPIIFLKYFHFIE